MTTIKKVRHQTRRQNILPFRDHLWLHPANLEFDKIPVDLLHSPIAYLPPHSFKRQPGRVKALEHIDFAIKESWEMKMQPSLERALRHKDILKA